MNKISLNKEDLEKISKILKKFPDVSHFELEESGNNGIGTVLDIRLFTEVNGVQGTFLTEVRGVESW